MEDSDFIETANEVISREKGKAMSLEEYVREAIEEPKMASHSVKYLFDAIRYYGQREVVESGGEKIRWCFFDDPENGGEHALLGNTDVLNSFVDDLQTIASGTGKHEKILWFEGPTATGKSEFKRCLLSGLSGYSRTEEGRRYTIEWNLYGEESGGMTYGNEFTEDSNGNWCRSPVQCNPLSIFPEEVRQDIVDKINENVDDEDIEVALPPGLDPFSREAFDQIEQKYESSSKGNLFSKVTDSKRFRVVNYIVGEGRGIGILQLEDTGVPKEKLVGSWMPGMLEKLDSRGRKNPQAFSYDGVISQGNGVSTIIEEGGRHVDVLESLLNIPEEHRIKIDSSIGMEIDTLVIIISNPDLSLALNQREELGPFDPAKALKRRLEKKTFNYLDSISIEVDLIRKEVLQEYTLDSGSVPMKDRKTTTNYIENMELAPRVIEVAAVYNVFSRIVDERDEGFELDLKAGVLDSGSMSIELAWGGEGEQTVYDKDDFPSGGKSGSVKGIPMTFTRDIIGDLIQVGVERNHPDVDVESVILPMDIIEEMKKGINESPIFNESENCIFGSLFPIVAVYLFRRQEADVLDSLLDDYDVTEEDFGEYVKQVYEWDGDQTFEDEDIELDDFEMMVFEREVLGLFSDNDYSNSGEATTVRVKKHRRKQIIAPITQYAWENRNDTNIDISSMDLREIPDIQTILKANTWLDVFRIYDDFSPYDWDQPLSGSETEKIKEKTIQTMMENYDYTEASAVLVSSKIMKEISRL